MDAETLIKAALRHPGPAFIDTLSPCVQFNNHAGSTKSYDYVREHNEAVNRLDVIADRKPIEVDYEPGTTISVTQHDGSVLSLHKLSDHYDPTDRIAAMVGSYEKRAEYLRILREANHHREHAQTALGVAMRFDDVQGMPTRMRDFSPQNQLIVLYLLKAIDETRHKRRLYELEKRREQLAQLFEVWDMYSNVVQDVLNQVGRDNHADIDAQLAELRTFTNASFDKIQAEYTCTVPVIEDTWRVGKKPPANKGKKASKRTIAEADGGPDAAAAAAAEGRVPPPPPPEPAEDMDVDVADITDSDAEL